MYLAQGFRGFHSGTHVLVFIQKKVVVTCSCFFVVVVFFFRNGKLREEGWEGNPREDAWSVKYRSIEFVVISNAFK